MSNHVSLRIALLDAQIVDVDRLPLGRVDDVELELGGTDQPPRAVALLTGAEALGDRLGGRLGHWMARAARRSRASSDRPGPARVDTAAVKNVGALIELDVPFAELDDVAGLERWLGERVERFPGAGDARD